MLHYSVVFSAIAILAVLLGFSGIWLNPVEILIFVFLILIADMYIPGLLRSKRQPLVKEYLVQEQL